MIKIVFENTQVWGFEHALRGMRNAKNSWDKADSYWKDGKYIIGPNDMKLIQSLIKGGPEHRKFMRQIFVSVDITAPLFWYKEFDTYKVGTVANSTSTMHTIEKAPITINNFEIDDCEWNLKCSDDYEYNDIYTYDDIDDFKEYLIEHLEYLRKKYLETRDKRYWKELIRWLPESWLQTRTITMNYENLFGMCSKGQRRFHKLNEWSGQDNPALENFISWARTLPYAQEIIFADELWEDEEKLKQEKIKAFNVLINALEKNGYDVNNMSIDEVLDEITNALKL